MKKLFLTNDYKTYSKLPKYNSSIVYRKEIGEILYNHDIHNLSSKYEYFTVEPLISDENLYSGININNRTSDYYSAEIPGKYRIISENNIGEWQNMSKTTVPLRPNEKIQFSIETFGYANYSPFTLNGYEVFYRISGNILSLIYGDNFIDNLDNTSNTYNFKNLFRYMTTVLYADRLYLPSYMCEGCFESMFEGCTNLITAPNFSNTSFGEYSCNRMFYNCISLQTAPEIYAMITASDCFKEMFYNCVNLNELTLFTCKHTAGCECTTDMLYNVNKNCQIYHNNNNVSSSITGYDALINGFNYKTLKNVKFIILNYTDNDIPSESGTGMLNDIKCYVSDNIFNWDEFVNSKYNINNDYIITQNINVDISNYLANEYENYIIYYKDKSVWSVTNDILFRPTWPNETAETYANIYYITDNIPANVEETYFVDRSKEYTNKYFTIVALEDDLTVKLSQNTSEYRIDNGDWITLSADTNTPLINKGQKISFKITNPTISTPYNSYYNSYGIGAFNVNKSFNVEGNIMSLLYGDNFELQTDLSGKNYAFYKLLQNCTKLQSAKNLILPATTLATHCYSYMFSGCTSLTKTPQLPATTLVTHCYSYMFSSCTSLTKTPQLHSTTLSDYCYYFMFSGCTSLTEAPELPATTLASSCYQYMFSGCTSLTEAPELPATTLAAQCYYSMFNGCTSLTEAPELPATALASSCYYYMFMNCKNLTTAPELPATTLAPQCYQYMFYGCSKLNYIKMLATNITAADCLNNWVNGVASNGTFVKHPDMTTLSSGANGIPNGWTIVNDGETNLITFYIDNTEYQAEEGMTWEEWCDSEFNKIQMIIQYTGMSLNVGLNPPFNILVLKGNSVNGPIPVDGYDLIITGGVYINYYNDF